MSTTGSGVIRKTVLAALAAFLLLLPGALAGQAAPDMEQLLPPDVDVFLRWSNPAGTEAYQKSALHGLLSEPEMQTFIDHADEELTKTLRAMAGRSPVNLPMARDVLDNGFSVALSLPSPGGEGPPLPRIALSAGFSTSAGEMEKRLLATLRRVAPPDFREPQKAFEHAGYTVKKLGRRRQPVFYTFMNGRWIAATGRDLMTAILDRAAGQGEALADEPDFKRGMDRIGGPDAAVALYANTSRLLSFAQPFVPPQARKLVGALKLNQVRAVAATSRFADGGMRDAIFLLAPERKGGLLPAPGATVNAALLELVPRNARAVSLNRVDIAGLYDAIMSAWKSANPRTYRQMTAMRDRWQQRLGFDIETDLVGSLGKQVLFYSTPHGHAFAVAVEDPETFDSCISSVAGTFSGRVELNTLRYRGHTIRHLDITGMPFVVTPSYTYHRGMAVFGLWPQAVKKFIARIEEDEPSIVQNEDFRRVCGDALGEKAVVQYSDIDDDLVSFYDVLVIGIQALNGLPQVKVRPELFPSNMVIEPHVFDAGSTWRSTSKGLVMETYSPYGTAGNLMAGIGAMAEMYTENASMTVPIMGAMLVPALQRARGAARQTACLNNLKMIGSALAMRRKDYDDRLPGNLMQLVPTYLSSTEVFVCPTDSDPFTIGDGTYCSYHYVGALPEVGGRPAPEIAVAYEDGDNHDAGRNVLFLDWHAETIPHDRFPRVMQRSLQGLKQGAWDELGEERKKELRQFYGASQER